MQLDKRLSAIARLVNKGGIVCDVGTDHGYIPAYLLENDICRYAYACDINEKPLKSAEKTLCRHIADKKAEVILSDGLKNVPPYEITDVVIAGMGAELISQIISGAEWLKNGINLVLQPMTRVNVMRKWLCENGFDILSEDVVKDDNHFYIIEKVVFSGEIYPCDALFELVGRVDRNNHVAKSYIEWQIARVTKIADGLKKSGNFEVATQNYRLAEQLKSLMEE